ncbi:hypothetical protein ACTWQF_06045 [Streptomyces sp. 8N114]|uniref:hypothetical protein n=1 Tax=Streptomyces sp. 8N114 TaxID=3457419 RepID=UPI003FD61AF2
MAHTPDRTSTSHLPRTSRTGEIPAKTDPAVPGPPRAGRLIAVGKLARALTGRSAR